MILDWTDIRIDNRKRYVPAWYTHDTTIWLTVGSYSDPLYDKDIFAEYHHRGRISFVIPANARVFIDRPNILWHVDQFRILKNGSVEIRDDLGRVFPCRSIRMVV